MKENYYKEIAISFAAAFAVGYFSVLAGIVTFFGIGLLLSKGSVPPAEMKKIMDEPVEWTPTGLNLDPRNPQNIGKV